MRRYEVVGDGSAPPLWRSVLFLPLVCLGSIFSVVFSRPSYAGDSGSGVSILILIVALLVAFGLGPAALLLRHRFPFAMVIAAALTSLLIPIGNTLPFILLGALLSRRRGPAVLWTTTLVGLTSTFVVVADALAQPVEASFFKTIFAPSGQDSTQPMDVHPVAVILVVVIGFGLAVGAGLLMRAHQETRVARRAARADREARARLGDEAARRQERERIAREVHDAMGHRLSLLNLHAGALEANAGNDTRLAESARLARTTASAAMDDLRSLLSVLRDPVGSDTADLPLARLAEVVHQSFGAGQRLNSSIIIRDAESAEPSLARAVYRIVQELLTNARKHAPDQTLWLSVEGGPDTGVVIDAHNRYDGGLETDQSGGSRGLAGITERTELLGGSMTYGLDQGGRVFRVRVELPWRKRPVG
ncbi:MAG: two-component sensor histidine kinase [Propionibacterium sp.]|nr:two-component sensor histidine kinase [Propionibacterium sp.]